MFYALPILDALYRSGLGSSLKSMSKFVIERIDYMLLPFVYFFIKIYFFSPSGKYKGYSVFKIGISSSNISKRYDNYFWKDSPCKYSLLEAIINYLTFN